jgi:hypothetical protein
MTYARPERARRRYVVESGAVSLCWFRLGSTSAVVTMSVTYPTPQRERSPCVSQRSMPSITTSAAPGALTSRLTSEPSIPV